MFNEPSVSWVGGTKFWYYGNGRKLHRDDGPAIEWNFGAEEWYMMGNRHRADGPAYTDPTENIIEWWWQDEEYEFNEFVIKAEWSNEKIIEYKLTHKVETY